MIRCVVLSLFILFGCTDDAPLPPVPSGGDTPLKQTTAKTPSDEHLKSSDQIKWTLVRVIDGDTIVAKRTNGPKRGLQEKIRLLRINTPEREQVGYEDATEALRSLLRDKKIDLVYEEEGIEKRGDYGRLLAYVFADGKNTNVEMVRLGWSKFWTKFGKGRFAKEFVEAQKKAMTQSLGLWK